MWDIGLSREIVGVLMGSGLSEGGKYHEENEKAYWGLFENGAVGVFQSTPEGKYIRVNSVLARFCGFSTPEEMMIEAEKAGPWFHIHPEDRTSCKRLLEEEGVLQSIETRFSNKSKGDIWISMHVIAVLDGKGKVMFYQGVVTDITRRKDGEEKQRKTDEELKAKSVLLEETATALKVLMRQREETEKELERTMVGNVRELVFPYIEKLKDGHLNEGQKMCLEMIESTLNNIISPFLQKITVLYSRFTPTELRIAHMIKGGKVTKEIAKLLNVGVGTVDTHRKSIRQKLGLSNKKINLQTYLQSLEEK